MKDVYKERINFGFVWPDNGQIVDRKETGLRFSHRVHNATLQQVLQQQGKSFFSFTSKISYTIHDTKDECQNAKMLSYCTELADITSTSRA